MLLLLLLLLQLLLLELLLLQLLHLLLEVLLVLHVDHRGGGGGQRLDGGCERGPKRTLPMDCVVCVVDAEALT